MPNALKAINCKEMISWAHHRGGWKAAMEWLAEHLHTDRGVRFFSSIEDLFHVNPGLHIKEPWVGFIHQAPRQNLEFLDLARLLTLPGWRLSQRNCLGLFSLTNYQRNYLLDNGVQVPISVVPYPCETNVKSFDLEGFQRNGRKAVVMVGKYLRRHESLFYLNAKGYDKFILGYPELTLDPSLIINSDGVHILDRIDDQAYDYLLTNSIIFLDLIDSTANTSVTECIVRNTPVLLNRTAGALEYLGADYPLFFEDLEDAASLLQDTARIVAAYDYLKAIPKDYLTYENFLERVAVSAVYRRAEATIARADL